MFRSRVALIAACVVLGGCATELEGGRYTCDSRVDAGSELAIAQCPGGTRCGLEDYCHPNGDTSVAWRCRNAADCENGFACGLSRDRFFRECHDPKPDGGAGAFACEVDTDCVLNWHCGVMKVCYDRTEKKPFPCNTTDDCSSGWRCGLDALCHDTKVLAAYPCLVDGDCEAPWRCGLAGRCLDPMVDALRVVTTAIGDAAKVNPLLLDHAPELIAASPVQSPSFNRPRQLISYFDRGTVGVIDLAIGEIPPIGTNPHVVQLLPDAGDVTSIATLGAISLTLVAQRDVGSWTYVTLADGGFREIHFRTTVGTYFDGTPTRPVWNSYILNDADNTPTALNVGSTEDGFVPTLVSFDDRPFSFSFGHAAEYWYGWGAFSNAAFYPTSESHFSDVAYLGMDFTVPGNRTSEITVLTAHRTPVTGISDQTDCSVIADSRGLWVQQQDLQMTARRFAATPILVPPFDNASCAAETGRPQNFHITRLAGLGSRWLGVAAQPMDAGVVHTTEDTVALIDVGNWFDVVEPTSERLPFRGCYALNDSRCLPDLFSNPVAFPVRATTVLGPCRVCAGGALVALSVVQPPQSPNPRLEVRCRSTSADGGSEVDAIVDVAPALASGAACVRTSVSLASSLGTDSVRISKSSSTDLAFGGPRGHLWVGRSSATAAPLFLDEAPFGALSDGSGNPVFLGADRIGWNVGPPLGIIAFPLRPADGERPVATVDGDQKAMVTGGRSIVTLDQVAPGEAPKVLASADGTPTRFEPPYHAVKAVRANGTEVMIVTAGDVVLAANLDLGKPLLERRLVPAEGKDIIALLTLPRSGPAGPVEAFALTTNALFKITSEAPQLWNASQAPLPEGEAIELWADGRRGRIGYRDGQVYSLETRVKIGASLGKRVDDFAQVCGQVYALAEGGLHRLELAGSAVVGTWKAVSFDGGLPASELEKGTILPFGEPDGGTSLYVFSRRGEAIRAPVTGCAPPQ